MKECRQREYKQRSFSQIDEIAITKAEDIDNILNYFKRVNEKDKVYNSLNTEGVAVLYGMAGIGKTTLLNSIHEEIAKKNEKYWPIYLEYSNKFDDLLVEKFKKDYPNYKYQDIISLLTNDCKKETVIFIDNYKKSHYDEKLKEVIKKYRTDKKIKLIISSREKLEFLHNNQNIHIKKFNDEECKKFFLNFYNREEQNKLERDNYIDKIVRKVDGNTLAIKTIAKTSDYIVKRKYAKGLKEIYNRILQSEENNQIYLEEMDNLLIANKENLEKLEHDEILCAKTILSTFNFYEGLSEESKRILIQLAVFNYKENFKCNIDFFIESTTEKNRSLLHDIADQGWLEVIEDANGIKEDVKIHSLILFVIRVKLSPTINNCGDLLSIISNRLKDENKYHETGDSNVFKYRNLKYIENVIYFYEDNDKNKIENIKLYLEVYYNIAKIYRYHGEINKAEEKLNKAIVLLDNFDSDEEDIEFFEVVANIYEESARINVRKDNNDLTKALELNRLSEKIRTEKLDKKNLENNFDIYGHIYTNENKEDYEKVIKYEEDGLELRKFRVENVNQEDRRVRELELADSYNSLGVTHYKMKRYNKALSYHKKALDIRKKYYLEKSNIRLAESFNNIGITYMELGNYDVALNHFNESLMIREDEYSENVIGIIRVMNNIGSAHCKKKEYGRAIEYLYDVLEKYKKCHEKYERNAPPKILSTTYKYLGTALMENENYDEAEERLLDSLKIRIQKINNEDFKPISLITIYTLLSDLQFRKEGCLKAKEYIKEIEELLGKNEFRHKFENAPEYKYDYDYYLKIKEQIDKKCKNNIVKSKDRTLTKYLKKPFRVRNQKLH